MLNDGEANQGKTVVEEADGEFRIMHPDGTVTVAFDGDAAVQKARCWYRSDTGRGQRLGFGWIEWRNANHDR